MISSLLRRFLACALIALPAASACAGEAEYTVNPGDVLQITVWKEDGLDRETLVLPDGTISFPLVGSMPVTGETVSQIASKIKGNLSTSIPDAAVTVVVKNAAGNVVDVLGQVNKPGEITVGHRVTVTQALSLAGGLTPYASTRRITVLHRANGQETSTAIPYNEIVKGESLDKDIELAPGDVVIVPASSLF